MAKTNNFLDTVRKLKNKHAGGGTRAYKLKEGKTRIRALMPLDSEEFHLELGVHWIKPSPDGKVAAVVGSPSIVYGNPSPLDAMIAKAINDAVDDDEVKLFESWRARKSILFLGVVRDGPDRSDDLQIIEVTPTTFAKMMSIVESFMEDEDLAISGPDIFSMENGIDFIFERKGKGLDTEYAVMAAPSSKKFDSDQVKQLKPQLTFSKLTDFVEREWFKPGAEASAMAAISQISGVTATAAIGNAAPAAKRLSNNVVEDAVIEDEEEGLDETDLRALEADIELEPEPEEEEPAPKPKTRAKKEKAPEPKSEEDEFDAEISDEELDALLAE